MLKPGRSKKYITIGVLQQILVSEICIRYIIAVFLYNRWFPVLSHRAHAWRFFNFILLFAAVSKFCGRLFIPFPLLFPSMQVIPLVMLNPLHTDKCELNSIIHKLLWCRLPSETFLWLVLRSLLRHDLLQSNYREVHVVRPEYLYSID